MAAGTWLYVMLMLPAGETRRFDMADVLYSGPIVAEGAATGTQDASPTSTAAGVVASEASVAADDPNTAELTLEAPGDVISFYAAQELRPRPGHPQYRRLCTAPCRFSIARGRYRLAMSHGSGAAVSTGRVLQVSGDVALEGRCRSRAGVRIAGWILFGLNAPAAAVGFVSAVCCDGCGGKSALLGLSIGFLVVSVVGLVMGLSGDRVCLDIRRTPSWGHEGSAN